MSDKAKKNKGEETLELAERLGPAYVAIRADLEVHRHLFGGVPSYAVRDPLTHKCSQLNQKDYTILTHITVSRTLAEVFQSLVDDGVLKPSEENGFYRFVLMLHQQALLNLPISNDRSLYKKYRTRQSSRRKAQLQGFLFLRVPLFDPDRILDKAAHVMNLFFTRWAFLIWILIMLFSAGILISKHDDLLKPVAQMFDTRNIVSMWITLIVLKILHEFGHACACKAFGGQVHEMGAFFIVMTPCAYVDVSSSWGFSNKFHRIIVGLGGLYFESMIAAIALIVWALAYGSIVQQYAHNVFFLASIATVVMNINPLMRFDGYYVLSDLVEMPNLRQRSQAYVLSIFKKVILGIPIANTQNSLKMSVFMFVFGVASSIYKVMLVLSISAVIAMKAFMVGIGMAGFYIFMEVLKITVKTTTYLWHARESAHVRGRAIALSVLMICLLPAMMFVVPMPAMLTFSGLLTCENEKMVHSQQDGFISEFMVEKGDAVKSEMTLAKLDNLELQKKYLDVKTKVDTTRLKLRQAYNDQVLSAKIMAMEQAYSVGLSYHENNISNLKVKSDLTGTVVAGFDHNTIGMFVKKGTPLGTVVSGRWVVKVLVDEQDIAKIELDDGRKVDVRFAAFPEHNYKGEIISVTPFAEHEVTMPMLTRLGEGDIAVDDSGAKMLLPHYEITILLDKENDERFRYGMIGKVKLAVSGKPIGITLFHKMLRFVNSLDRQ